MSHIDEKQTFNYNESDTVYMKAVWNAWVKDKEHLPNRTKLDIQAQWIKGEISLLLYSLP